MSSSRGVVVVVGCGSIGRRHIGNLQTLGRRVVAFDPDPSRSEWARKNLGCETVDALERALDARPSAVWVCTPPHVHADGAAAALERRIPCFIEKPLAHDLRAATRITAAAARRKTPVAVGYQLRFHPAMRWLKQAVTSGRYGRLMFLRAHVGQYLPDWRPWQDYRRSYTARRAMGGGILLDASHELDLARWLAGEAKTVYCRARKLSRLEIDVEDTAAVQLDFASGALGEVHLDMVSRAPRRGVELALEEATLLWDQPSRELRVYTARAKRWTARKYEFDFNELYVSEAAAFLRGSADSVSARDGAATLAVVAAAARSAQSNRLEKVNL